MATGDTTVATGSKKKRAPRREPKEKVEEVMRHFGSRYHFTFGDFMEYLLDPANVPEHTTNTLNLAESWY